MTYPNGGCHTCKIRRIKARSLSSLYGQQLTFHIPKCDETQPTCQRCIKSRRICIKTTAQKANFLIHIENRYASGETKRPRGPRSSLTPALYFDLQTRAVIYYLNYHLRMPSDVQCLPGSVADSIVEWVSGTTIPMIDLAISSMALAVFSRTQQHPVAAMEACARYDELLRHAQITMPTVVETNIDAALLAVFLMSRYEDSAYNAEESQSNVAFNSFTHHDGATSILKIWRHRHPRDMQPATDIVKHSRRGIIRSAILRYLAVPSWLEDGRLFGERGQDLEYDRILVRVANLRNQLMAVQQNNSHLETIGHELFQRAQKLNSEAAGLDKALQEWAIQIPSACHPRRHPVRTDASLPAGHLFSSVIYSYPGIGYAALWLNYSATRMLLNRAWLRILELIQPLSDESTWNQQMEQCRTRIMVTADDLSSSIPFVLERFKVTNAGEHQTATVFGTNEEIRPYVASLAAWPLSVASGIGSLHVERKQWFRTQLALIGRILGSGVLACVGAAGLLDL
ncbi:uncharacterized protein Z519_04512 [Cladophialophora bantiana CBS 173.52]|uniref:Zn(2)-C6 fungal-type domain-containing protein n=1 Tax=Cladophialophora bantiana (strain ATCC 10958 / CBS 173.52 / CDC B-1940 / NIH 8579) TaxID=1442370 RepID=A0A0D2EXB9_CLAB1|nr:uncharacterized protein Z519_04512 [Cladophialophora bantiana CBS 173.52]KIW94536.1 hypothetical protein Z519_04512 [Cladophialophora bantiana CBS 173.52]